MSEQQPEWKEESHIHHGYIQNNLVNPPEVPPNMLGFCALIGKEIDSALYKYNQITAAYYNQHFSRSNGFDMSQSLYVHPGHNYGMEQLSCMAELWKINFDLLQMWNAFYEELDDSVTIRVYNNEPIMITTPSNCGYIVIHPCIQEQISFGTDEYGEFYEANLGGMETTCGVIGGHYLHTRRVIRKGLSLR